MAPRDLSKWPHLRDLDIPEADVAGVDLLIGQDNSDLLVPLEIRAGAKGEPYAVRTTLGWGISGPIREGHHRHHEFSSHFVNLDAQVEKF